MLLLFRHFFFTTILIGGFCCLSYSQISSLSIESMSKNADIIVTGKVIQQNSSWNENKTKIYTQANIQVDEYIKGNGKSSILVSYLGGEVGDVGEIYSHMPKFEDQEEVLVFLKKDEKSTGYKVFNGEDGKLNLIVDPKTGEKVTSSHVPINSLKAQIKSYISD